MHIPTSYINTCIYLSVCRSIIRIIIIKKSLPFLPYGDRHLYENNYLPITGYDEIAGIQFVDRLMLL